MRILTLEFAGLGPYRGEQTVDFAALEHDGLYLIAGRTGAGKSTILDAITFALYGSVPRFDGGEKHLRSDHCEPGDETWVRLEFEAGGQRYRIRRSPDYERPKSRGTGTTTQKASGVLERGGPVWEGVSTSLREIGELVPEIVGLTGPEFLQVTLLAQNRFSEFLLAPNDKRQTLLRRLFGTHRFEALRRRIVDRARESGRELELERALLAQQAEQLASTAGIEAPSALETPWFETIAEHLTPELAAIEERWRLVDAEATAVEAALTAARGIAEQQMRRDAARSRAAQLDAQQPVIEAVRAELELARRVEAVHPLTVAERDAHSRVEAAASAAERAAADYRGLEHEPDPAKAADDADALQSAIGALDAALQDETRLPGLEGEHAAAETAVLAAEAELERIAGLATSLPERIAQLGEQLAADQQLAVLAPERRAGESTPCSLSARPPSSCSSPSPATRRPLPRCSTHPVHTARRWRRTTTSSRRASPVSPASSPPPSHPGSPARSAVRASIPRPPRSITSRVPPPRPSPRRARSPSGGGSPRRTPRRRSTG